MSAAVVYVFNERTTSWRTQTPGVASAGSSTLTCWAYNPQRRSVVWSQDGNGNQPDIYKNLPDSDLTTPIPGAVLMTFPQVPDGDATAMKRYHEVEFTFSVITAGAQSLTLDYAFGADAGSSLSVAARAMPNNPVTPSVETPAYYQARVLVARTNHIGPSLIVYIGGSTSTDRGIWRLHAIDITWQPESPRSLQR